MMKNSKLTFVLMAGLPGTGKSTLAYELGHILGWYVIDKDEYMVKLQKEGKSNKIASEEAYKQSFEIARTMLTEQHTSVILDSAAIDPLTLNNAMGIVCNYENIQLKVILCYVCRELRIKRVKSKPSPSSTKVDPNTLDDYLQYFNHLPSDRLILHTNKPTEECLIEAVDFLMS